MVSILMTTFNGERFLEEQIDSILAQTEQRFTLYIRDDDSSDSTWNILQRYAVAHPNQVFVDRNSQNSGSAQFNFFSLMTTVRDDYIMLCDQDDIWLSDKIECSLAKIQEMELQYSTNTPLLVHTDLQVVDDNLNTLSESFRYAMNADYNKTALNQQLIQNTLTGCTAIYNRALADKLTQIPEYCVMHDWWLMLIASSFGKIGHIDEPTILYRQHDSNEIGAKNVRTLCYKLNRLLHYKEMRQAITDTYYQAESFLNAYRAELTSDQIALLEEYCDIPNRNKFLRWRTIVRLGCLKNGLARKIANFIFI